MPCTALTKCGHIMHTSCLSQWHRRVGKDTVTCPLCRSEANVKRNDDGLKGDVVALKFDVKLKDPPPQAKLPVRGCACANGCVCFDDFEAVAVARGMAPPPAQQLDQPPKEKETEGEGNEGSGNDKVDDDNHEDEEGDIIRRLEAAASTVPEDVSCGEPSPVAVKPEPDAGPSGDGLPPAPPLPSSAPPAAPLIPAPPPLRIPVHVAIPRYKEALMIAYTRLSAGNPAETARLKEKNMHLSGELLREKQNSAKKEERLTSQVWLLQEEVQGLSNECRAAKEDEARAKEARWKLEDEHKKERLRSTQEMSRLGRDNKRLINENQTLMEELRRHESKEANNQVDLEKELRDMTRERDFFKDKYKIEKVRARLGDVDVHRRQHHSDAHMHRRRALRGLWVPPKPYLSPRPLSSPGASHSRAFPFLRQRPSTTSPSHPSPAPVTPSSPPRAMASPSKGSRRGRGGASWLMPCWTLPSLQRIVTPKIPTQTRTPNRGPTLQPA